jgi:hypothetical protein
MVKAKTETVKTSCGQEDLLCHIDEKPIRLKNLSEYKQNYTI